MQDHVRAFLEFSVKTGVLRFGEFTLKSGRQSPYFFNTGLFDSGAALSRLGQDYARTIAASGISFDILYGPAYKGIPLSAVTAAALYERHNINVGYAFNRKEAKDHGEGGIIVGRPLTGRVLIIDDVISAGTSVRESVEIIRTQGAKPVGIAIALDRQERGQGELSAIQEVERDFRIPVAAIARLDDLVHYLEEHPDSPGDVDAIRAYRKQYGVSQASA